MSMRYSICEEVYIFKKIYKNIREDFVIHYIVTLHTHIHIGNKTLLLFNDTI